MLILIGDKGRVNENHPEIPFHTYYMGKHQQVLVRRHSTWPQLVGIHTDTNALEQHFA